MFVKLLTSITLLFFALNNHVMGKEYEQLMVIDQSLNMYKLDPVTNNLSKLGKLSLPGRRGSIGDIDISVWPGYGMLIDDTYGGPYVFDITSQTLTELELIGNSFIAINYLKILYYERADSREQYLSIYDLRTQANTRISKVYSPNSFSFSWLLKMEDDKVLLATEVTSDLEAKCSVLAVNTLELSPFDCTNMGTPRMNLGNGDILLKQFGRLNRLSKNGKIKKLNFLNDLPVFYYLPKDTMYMLRWWDTLLHGMRFSFVAVDLNTKKKTTIKKHMAPAFVAPLSGELESLINSELVSRSFSSNE